jgi:hypothetical protein
MSITRQAEQFSVCRDFPSPETQLPLHDMVLLRYNINMYMSYTSVQPILKPEAHTN